MEPPGEPSHHHGAGQVLPMELPGEPSHHHGACKVLPRAVLGSASHHHGAGKVPLKALTCKPSHHHGAGKVLPTVLSANPKPGIEKRSPEGRSKSDGRAGMEMMRLISGIPHRGVTIGPRGTWR